MWCPAAATGLVNLAKKERRRLFDFVGDVSDDSFKDIQFGCGRVYPFIYFLVKVAAELFFPTKIKKEKPSFVSRLL